MQSNLRLIINLKKSHDRIPGGLADGKPDDDFDPDDLVEGIAVEREHSRNVAMAKEIAKDHLTEDPKYYKKLKKIEKGDQFRDIKDMMAGKRPANFSYTEQRKKHDAQRTPHQLILGAAQNKPVEPQASKRPLTIKQTAASGGQSGQAVQTSANTFYGGTRPPGGGWMPIPGSKHGGYHRRQGQGYQYWYPDKATHDAHHPELVEQKKPEPAKVQVSDEIKQRISDEKNAINKVIKDLPANSGNNVLDIATKYHAHLEQNGSPDRRLSSSYATELKRAFLKLEPPSGSSEVFDKLSKNKFFNKKLVNQMKVAHDEYVKLYNEYNEATKFLARDGFNRTNVSPLNVIDMISKVADSKKRYESELSKIGKEGKSKSKKQKKLFNEEPNFKYDYTDRDYHFRHMSDEELKNRFSVNWDAFDFSENTLESIENLHDDLYNYLLRVKSNIGNLKTELENDNSQSREKLDKLKELNALYNEQLAIEKADKPLGYIAEYSRDLLSDSLGTDKTEEWIKNNMNSLAVNLIKEDYPASLVNIFASRKFKIVASDEKIKSHQVELESHGVEGFKSGGYYDYHNKEIVLPGGGGQLKAPSHEFGHWLDWECGMGLQHYFEKLPMEYVSHYGRALPQEDVAESLSMLSGEKNIVAHSIAPHRKSIVDYLTDAETALKGVLMFKIYAHIGDKYSGIINDSIFGSKRNVKTDKKSDYLGGYKEFMDDLRRKEAEGEK